MGASFLNLVATKVTIKGEEQKFVSLRLHQSFNKHHDFTVIVNYLSPNNTFQQTPEKFINFIGETITISFTHRQTSDSYVFEGVVTKVEMIGSEGEAGGIAIHGESPTILFDSNCTLDSWTEQSLSAIINEATQEYGNEKIVIAPKYTNPISYLAQYNESAFAFMNRLSLLYGEWFYYDGNKIYFGKPENINTAKLQYDVDLEEVRLIANMVPGKSARYDYVAQENKEHNADTPAKPERMSDLQSIAHARSEKAYPVKVISPANPHIKDKAELDDQMKRVRNASGARLLNISGTGKTCRIRIGEIIDVSFPDKMKLSPLGKYLVTEIIHEVHRDGHYSNTFFGIPSDTTNLPVSDVRFPTAMPELATVQENKDEKGQGRVKVHFQWQKGNKTTNWIRVQSPNAGTSDAVSKNRGLVFVPEIGDQVMIGYEHGNPDRPYVSGAMFHSESGQGGGDNNQLKTIITRSGNAIIFNDEAGSITIKDQTGKQLILLDGKDSITIMAKKSVIITNESESIIAMEDKSIGMKAETICLEAEKNIAFVSGDENLIISKEKTAIATTGTNIKVEAQSQYEQTSKAGTVTANNMSIEGTADVTVTGGIVKINS